MSKDKNKKNVSRFFFNEKILGDGVIGGGKGWTGMKDFYCVALMPAKEFYAVISVLHRYLGVGDDDDSDDDDETKGEKKSTLRRI